MRTDTGTHTTTVHRSIASAFVYALLHLAIGVGIFFLIRESLPQMRKDIQILIGLLAAILGAGFLRTWTSESPEETFMAAIVAALLAFVSYISVYLFQDARTIPHYLKMGIYAGIALVSGGLSVFSIYLLLLGGHRRLRT